MIDEQIVMLGHTGNEAIPNINFLNHILLIGKRSIVLFKNGHKGNIVEIFKSECKWRDVRIEMNPMFYGKEEGKNEKKKKL